MDFLAKGNYNMKIKIGLVSLGCAKNQVDSEQVLGMLNDSGFEIVSSPSIKLIS